MLPTADQVVQWILEHMTICPRTSSNCCFIGSDNDFDYESSLKLTQPEHISEEDFENESSDGSLDMLEDCSIQEYPIKYEVNKQFLSADQYAMYVRGLVCPGVKVRCCQNFEEIKKGDFGEVLKVDTEGLHDLNVQVNKIHYFYKL